MLELNSEEKKTLEVFLLSELKKTQHYSIMKSKRLISIAEKVGLSKNSIDEMKKTYFTFYKTEY